MNFSWNLTFENVSVDISVQKFEISNLKSEIQVFMIPEFGFICSYPCSSVCIRGCKNAAYRSPHFSLLRRISKYDLMDGRTSCSFSGALLILMRSPLASSIPTCQRRPHQDQQGARKT